MERKLVTVKAIDEIKVVSNAFLLNGGEEAES